MKAHTPLLKQYFQVKEQHPGVLIAMRVGDFFEFYGDDAETAAAALEITLTGREDGKNGRVAMAGVPHHALEKYIARLLSKGYKVGICDQLEDPKKAKGLVKRDITRILTPGTVLEDSMLQSSQNNFLAALCVIDGKVGLSVLDPSTGDFQVTEIEGELHSEKLMQELARLRPAELLMNETSEAISNLAEHAMNTSITEYSSPGYSQAEAALQKQLNVSHLQGFGCADKPAAIVAASMVLNYVKKNGVPTDHIDTLSTYSTDDFMALDLATRKSLELVQNLSDGARSNTLLKVLDQTVTAMGSRLLRRWVDQPLLNKERIQNRQDCVSQFINNTFARGSLRDHLKQLSDIERLVSRISTKLASPRDLAALRNSLRQLPNVLKPLSELQSQRISELKGLISDHSELSGLLAESIVAEPPHGLKDGGVIQDGFDLELDKLRELSRNGKTYIAQLEQQEKESTGISNLKVGYNSVFGYYLEVSKIHTSKVPAEYIRKQTTANAERYITAELKEHESAILGAEQKAHTLETEIFNRIRNRVAEHANVLLQTARAVSELDVLSTFAEVSIDRSYCQPILSEEDVVEIKSGRHPIVEANFHSFVPNDLDLGIEGDAVRTVILTGPNMSGKSTYLRQTALIALMAQIGCYVPAESCKIGLCDRIFARIGAKDELALGQSTFMVEMVESANILNNATSRSLVILDEVGRGTSTYDGLAIAWAMTEYLNAIGCKMLFATHYHQLNSLADQLDGIANYRVSVEEFGDEIVWTHKVLPGGTDRSYGIHVAKMAGVPPTVLSRSADLLGQFEKGKNSGIEVSQVQENDQVQLTLFQPDDPRLIQELKDVDVNALTPINALKLLDSWKSKYAKK